MEQISGGKEYDGENGIGLHEEENLWHLNKFGLGNLIQVKQFSLFRKIRTAL